MLKTILQVVLWVVCALLAFAIYKSVTGPIEFEKVRQDRFQSVINALKDIRNSQEAYRTVNGSFAKDFQSLIAFVDTGNYTITQRRDSSYMEYDQTYGIDLLKEVTIIDTLGFVAVKDSLFRGDDRYRTMMNVPGAQGGETFEMKADILEKSGFRTSVFEAKVKKDVILYDQPQDLVDRELAHVSVEEVNGTEIKVGSLTDVSLNGNWPPIYDKRTDN